MSWHINKKSRKDGSIGWRLLRSDWKDNKRTWEHIPSSQLLQHGLSPNMSLEEARVRVKQLNAAGRLDKEAERSKVRALRQAKAAEVEDSAYVPSTFAAEFVESYLRTEMERGTDPEGSYLKSLSHWAMVKDIVKEVKLQPSDWYTHKRRFYTAFAKRKISSSYAGKVLRVLNLWGTFMALKTGSSYIPIPAPRGVDREAIQDAHFASGKKSKESKPLSLELLMKAEPNLKPKQYRWLYISHVFGLRPPEVDGLKKPKLYRVEHDDKLDVPVVWIYQTKLTGVERDKRWKPIPCVEPEQRKALEWILAADFERPLVKTLHNHISDGFNCYAGRKGFTTLMLDRGYRFEDISIWLGHTNISTTWKSYTERNRVTARKVG